MVIVRSHYVDGVHGCNATINQMVRQHNRGEQANIGRPFGKQPQCAATDTVALVVVVVGGGEV